MEEKKESEILMEIEEKERTSFDELYEIDVWDKVEQKNGFNYLSWAYAWATVKSIFPKSNYKILKFGESQQPYTYDEKTGYMVFTEVTIEDITHEMWLPVMDGANKAMKDKSYTYHVKEYVWNPETKKKEETGEVIEKTVESATMFDINKTIMRCLVKNLAMFGLGLGIYAGEDLPEEKIETLEQAEKLKITFGKYSGKTLEEINEENPSYIEWLAIEAKDEIVKQGAKLLLSKEQAKIDLIVEFDKKMRASKSDMGKVLKHFKVETLAQLTDEQRKKGIEMFNEKIKKLPKEEVF